MDIAQTSFYHQAILTLAALVVLASFVMLGQGRLLRIVFVLALQGALLALATALAAFSTDNPHFYISSAITMVLKVILIPIMLRRLVIRMNIHREVEELTNRTSILLGGASLVIFSYYVMLPIVHTSHMVTLNAIAVSLAVVLLGMLMMISHRNAVAHVAGFMSIENGLFFAAIVSTSGMPMVVELGIAFDVLVAAVLFGVFFFHIHSSIDSLDVDRLNRLNEVEK